MKLSQVLHVVSVVTGVLGTGTFVRAIIIGGNRLDNLVFGVTKMDALLCAGILMLIAVWTAISTMHHMMLEKQHKIL